MKITIDVDCTPDEARAFFGLPDTGPLQRAFVEEMQKRMTEAMTKMDADAMVKAWLPQGTAAWEQWQKMWSEVATGPKARK
ncbi:MAG: DUF6489 family protein [Alphaproteobacteria bacterium]